MRFQLIEQQADLLAQLDSIRRIGRFAFDTEFVGEDRYKPELCLIQIATETEQILVDPLAGIDARPFWDLVADPNIEKILHAGSEDLAMCTQQISRPAVNVFDVQIAAGFVGFGYPTSLARLTKVATGEKLHKTQTLTDWRARPLSREQVEYGVEDVIHLPSIHRSLVEKLRVSGRIEWVREECEALCEAVARQSTGPVQVRRLKGMGALTGRELTIAEAVLDLRDQLAREMDRPPRTVIRDHLLVELARRGWTDPRRIGSLRGLNLSAASIRRVAETIDRARSLPPKENPIETEADTPEEEVLYSVLTAVLRDYCNNHSIAYSLLATKDYLRELVRGITRPDAAPASILDGWRGQAVGELLQGILSGSLSLRVDRGREGLRLRIDNNGDPR
ncbi:MAG TPA: HRDC domain-containing protein [Phycisphaerae bacterium]|nr:HRDC domain-containing protein [Phycisphaerae bacterium]